MIPTILKNFRINFTKYGDDKRISFLSIIVIVFLDIFTLIIVFQGLGDQTKLLPDIYKYAPYKCREFLSYDTGINKGGSIILEDVVNKMNNIHMEYSNNNNSFSTQYNVIDKDKMCMSCDDFYDKIKVIFDDKMVMQSLDVLQNLYTEKYNLQNEIQGLYPAYNLSLLEEIAKKGEQYIRSQNVEQSIKDKILNLNNVVSFIPDVENKLLSYNNFNSFFKFISDNSNQSKLRSDIEVFEFWYPVNRFFIQMLFLIPLFLLILLWHNRNIQKLNIQSLISSHILIVVFIPIFINLIQLVVDLIPKKFLEFIWNLLVQYNILAIWYYIVLILGIAVAIFVIYIMQKGIYDRLTKNKKDVMIYRLQTDLCVNCGYKLTHQDVEFCYFCGFKRYVQCQHCKAKTLYGSRYCMECGSEL